MAGYVLSPGASDDIHDIWSYTADRWDAVQAETYIRQLQRGIESIAANPSLGRPCDNIRQGYRRYSVGRHILFYRIIDEIVDVVRILHQSMDFDRHL